MPNANVITATDALFAFDRCNFCKPLDAAEKDTFSLHHQTGNSHESVPLKSIRRFQTLIPVSVVSFTLV